MTEIILYGLGMFVVGSLLALIIIELRGNKDADS